jgi:hypothetical protein
MIDGAHRGDDALIRNQIEIILRRRTVDLLVITHCHGDHIGCLPALVTSGQLRCEWALLADPELGYGAIGKSLAGNADAPGPIRLLTALREEPLRRSSDQEIAGLLEDAARQRNEYQELIRYLRKTIGNRLVLFRGSGAADTEGLSDLEAAFAETGFRALGPSRAQLNACAAQLTARAEVVALRETPADSVQALIATYRRIIDGSGFEDGTDDTDGGGLGRAVNNQSIVIACGGARSRVLLTGDMQLAEPGMSGVEFTGALEDLRERIGTAGPYAFIKLSHHGSSNGIDRGLLDRWNAPNAGISTGSRNVRAGSAPVGHHLNRPLDKRFVASQNPWPSYCKILMAAPLRDRKMNR